MFQEYINPTRFKDRVAIVTGGGSGIGEEIALRFAKEGAAVAIPDIDLDAARDTAAAIEKLGGEALPLKTDVSKPESVQEMVNSCAERFKKIDILVNNAGIVVREPLLELEDSKWMREIEVDLNGVAFCIKYTAQKMKKNNKGKIVNISSVAGLIGAVAPAYTAAKGGVVSLTRILAGELAPYKININTVCPGFIKTPINESLRKAGLEEMLIKSIPLRRWGETKDIAAVTAFLASDEADFITGAILQVDGGLGSFIDLGKDYTEYDR